MMHFIKPMMLEPATASIAIYLLAKSPLELTKKKYILIKKPFHIKKRVCQWLYHNKHELTDTVIDETSDYIIDIINIINIFKINPSIYMLCYIVILITVIII